MTLVVWLIGWQGIILSVGLLSVGIAKWLARYVCQSMYGPAISSLVSDRRPRFQNWGPLNSGNIKFLFSCFALQGPSRVISFACGTFTLS
jgi:hypothetical protein